MLGILGHRSYPGSPGSPTAVAVFLASLTARPGHVFWASSISLLTSEFVERDRLLTAAHLTDTYLLALARHHDARLATFDRRLATSAVADGARYLEVIG